MTENRAYPFTLTIAGLTVHGVVVASEAEVAELLSRGLVEEPASATASESAQICAFTRGRPSFDDVIEAAIEALGAQFDQCKSIAAAARPVLHHLSKPCDDPELLPARPLV
jgi:hypothetical protein